MASWGKIFFFEDVYVSQKAMYLQISITSELLLLDRDSESCLPNQEHNLVWILMQIHQELHNLPKKNTWNRSSSQGTDIAKRRSEIIIENAVQSEPKIPIRLAKLVQLHTQVYQLSLTKSVSALRIFLVCLCQAEFNLSYEKKKHKENPLEKFLFKKKKKVMKIEDYPKLLKDAQDIIIGPNRIYRLYVCWLFLSEKKKIRYLKLLSEKHSKNYNAKFKHFILLLNDEYQMDILWLRR